MLTCLDCGKKLKHIKLNYDEEHTNDLILCPICESDNVWDDQLEMYINENGAL